MVIELNSVKIFMPTAYIWASIAIPLLYLYLLQFTNKAKIYKKGFDYILFIDYIVLLLCLTLICRNSGENVNIQSELLWGYQNPPNNIVRDNVANILAFFPIGIFICIISNRFSVIKSFLFGLLLSETIECSQLIFKRGSFDVDDIINNTAGAFFGAILYKSLYVIWSKICRRERDN